MTRPLNILFIAAEASPFVKIGGLGDVIGSLPKTLRKAGHDARVVLPKHTVIRSGYRVFKQEKFSVNFIGRQEEAEVIHTSMPDGTPVYLVGSTRYFNRPSVYGEYDDAERFLFFCRVALEIPHHLDWKPDIVHSHDWHTAICSAILKADYKTDRHYSGCGSVFTIHNLAYQGPFHESFVAYGGLHNYLIPPNDPFRNLTFNMMAIGLYHSDVITTVSQTYAGEILSAEYGCGMEGLLKKRQDRILGILNGIDYDEFNPATDPLIYKCFDVTNLAGKREDKLFLQRRVNLPSNPDIPLVGMAGRLVDQKGPDIAAEAIQALLPNTDVQFILQGLGETRYLELLENLERINTRKARVFFVLDFSLVQQIYSGCDIFLMPSRFEPCGLAPMIAMRYGTVPVVRHTGGMVETTPDCSPDLSTGRGFNFERYDAGDLLVALKRALAAYTDKGKWRQLVLRDMQTDFTWNPAVPKYEAAYELAIQHAAER